MVETKTLLRQEEGVQLWQRCSSAGEIFMIRSLRTRERWEFETADEAGKLFDREVVECRNCAMVQKKLGSF